MYVPDERTQHNLGGNNAKTQSKTKAISHLIKILNPAISPMDHVKCHELNPMSTKSKL